MRCYRLLLLYAALLVVGLTASQARAAVLASDDFSSATSGVGWAVGSAWEALENGYATTMPTGGPHVTNFRDFAAPLDASNGVTYVKIDYAQMAPGNGAEWGGLAFFTGIEGTPGDETFFMGNATGTSYFSLDLKNGQVINSPVPIDNKVHTLIASIDTTGPDDVYKFWVDNVNLSAPSATHTVVGGGPIATPWGTLRLGSQDTTTDTYDNLVIGTSPADVGLVASTLTLTVNRSTGVVSLNSPTALTRVVGYEIRSNDGALKPGSWTTVTGHYDSPANGGNGSVDSNDAWTVLSTDPNDKTSLAEFSFSLSPGDGGTIGATAVNLGSIWAKTPYQDLTATVIVDEGGTQKRIGANVVYTGAAPLLGDLNGDGSLNSADWALFKSGQGAVNNTLSPVAAYQMGDLNGDFDHSLQDFNLFAVAYDAANGVGAFTAMVASVPEPSALLLLVCGMAGCLVRRRGKPAVVAAALVVFVTVAAAGNTAKAVVLASDDFSAEGSGTGWAAGDNWGNVAGGVADTQLGNAGIFRAFANPIAPYDYDKLYIGFDFKLTAGNQWGGLAFFTGPTGGAETLFVGDPGQYDAYGIDMKQGGVLPANPLPAGTPATNTAFHRLIVELDFDNDGAAPFMDKYSLWVDGSDISAPTYTVTIDNSPITTPWQSIRLQSAGGGEWFQVDNLIITDEPDLVFTPTLNLQVNKATGAVTIRNTTGTPIPISAYSIESAGGTLNSGSLAGDFNGSGGVDGADFLQWQREFPALDAGDLADWKANFGASGPGTGGWSSLADQNLAGFPAGNGSGNGWEEGAHPSPNELEEYFLTGQSSVAAGATLSLGQAYADGAAGAQDIQFFYRSNGDLKVGTVSYVGGALSAVPEPGGGVLAIVGLAALACRGRRGRQG
jgi:hypothetical protein